MLLMDDQSSRPWLHHMYIYIYLALIFCTGKYYGLVVNDKMTGKKFQNSKTEQVNDFFKLVKFNSFENV